MDGFSYTIDVQGSHALVAYCYFNLPGGMRINCVLIDLTNMSIEKNYSDTIAGVFDRVACRYRSRFTLVKLKYDILFVALDNNLMVLDRNSGDLKWSFPDLCPSQTCCIHNPDINFDKNILLIRNCMVFNALEDIQSNYSFACCA